MSKPNGGIVALFFLFCFFPVHAHGETIYYSIRQLGFDGNASLTMVGPTNYKKHKTVLIVFKAKSKTYWDRENIYVDPKTYKPLFVERYFSLSYFGHGRILEEYKPGKISITKVDGKKITHQEIDKGNVDNIYGFIYRYRKEGKFRIGDELTMTLPTKDLKLKLVKREALRVGKKSYDSYFMESEPSRYKLWFDTSKHKWPLRITGSVGLLNSVMTMTGYKE